MTAHPPGRRRRLRQENHQRQPAGLQRRPQAHLTRAPGREHQRADHGLHQVVGQRHPARRRQPCREPRAQARTQHQQEGAGIAHGQQRRCEQTHGQARQLPGRPGHRRQRGPGIESRAGQARQQAQRQQQPQRARLAPRIFQRLPPSQRIADQEHGEGVRPLHQQQHDPDVLDELLGVLPDHGTDRAPVGLQGGEHVGPRLRRDLGARRVQQAQAGQHRPGRRGESDEPQRQAQRAGGLKVATAKQQQAQDGVGQQDVAVIEQHGMRRAQRGQARQPPQETRQESRLAALGGRHLQGEAVAEQEREQQIELGLEQQAEDPAGREIQRASERGIDHAAAVIRRGEHADVDDQDAEQREAPERIHLLQPRGSGRSRAALICDLRPRCRMADSGPARSRSGDVRPWRRIRDRPRGG